MEEEWKGIKEYPMYEISSLGRVRSYFKTGGGTRTVPKLLCNKIDRIGYSFIHLKNDNGRKPLRIHRLVAEAFLPNPNNYPEVNHLDENKQNNCISNLEWCTRYTNTHYSKVWSHTERKVCQYDVNNVYIRTWNSLSEASRFINVTPQSVFNAIKHNWKSGGYYWKYA